MMFRAFLNCPIGLLAILSLCIGAPTGLFAKDSTEKASPIEWRMASAFPGSALQLGTLGRSLAETVTAISGGDFKLRFIEPNVLERPFRLFDAVSQDKIEAAWATPSYWSEKDPAFALFSSIPFGPDAAEYLAWMKYGGGNALRDELYEPYGVISITCGAMAPEAGGWFRKEIRSIDSFKGLKMRTFGLGAQVLELFGVEPQLIAHDKLIEALRHGTLDAAEFSIPAIDTNVGFEHAGRLFYYFPGWHQQTTLFEFLVSHSTWLALPEKHRRQVQVACDATLTKGIAEGEALQARAILDIRDRGTEIRRFSPDVLNRLEKGWQEVAALLSTKSKNFERIWTSLTGFREEYRVWRELGYFR